MDDIPEIELSSYEKLRLEKIRKNEQRLRELGLCKNMIVQQQPKKKQSTIEPKKQSQSQSLPTRRSTRKRRIFNYAENSMINDSIKKKPKNGEIVSNKENYTRNDDNESYENDEKIGWEENNQGDEEETDDDMALEDHDDSEQDDDDVLTMEGGSIEDEVMALQGILKPFKHISTVRLGKKKDIRMSTEKTCTKRSAKGNKKVTTNQTTTENKWTVQKRKSAKGAEKINKTKSSFPYPPRATVYGGLTCDLSPSSRGHCKGSCQQKWITGSPRVGMDGWKRGKRGVHWKCVECFIGDLSFDYEVLGRSKCRVTERTISKGEIRAASVICTPSDKATYYFTLDILDRVLDHLVKWVRPTTNLPKLLSAEQMKGITKLTKDERERVASILTGVIVRRTGSKSSGTSTRVGIPSKSKDIVDASNHPQ